ncbi:MAG: TIGR03084 family metal-binding protein [Ferrimicrobium sp.]
MTIAMSQLLADLAGETEVVIGMVEALEEPSWNLPTPAEGWTIKDQISHLAFFDEAAALAATDLKRFHVEADALAALGDDFPDVIALRYHQMSAEALLEWFRRARQTLIETFMPLDPHTRLPWYGPDMSTASSITARIMETWAHGQDIADTLGIEREATSRLRNIAHLGVQTFAFAHMLHGLEPPDTPVRVELESPSADVWVWGPDDAIDRVTGTALEFCLVVTQRRHLADTTLIVRGSNALRWMSIAQAFAGAPRPGRQPGQFPRTHGTRP